MSYFKDIDTVILCGGKGTRLRQAVSDRPKSMAKIDGRPFLDILIEYLKSFGLKRVILCTGYMASVIRNYYANKKYVNNILFSEEDEPLGTGGALKNAEHMITSDPFLVMNGDSYCHINLEEFFNFHLKKKALISIAALEVDNTGDYGLITINKSQKIDSFQEKTKKGEAFINAGIYIFNKKILSLIPPYMKYSLEYDLFQKFVGREFYSYTTQSKFVDIGTPERYALAQQVITNFNLTK